LGVLGGRRAARAPEVTVVLPAYNEVGTLRRAVEETADFLGGMGREFEILIAEDGSTDGTAELARSIADSSPNVRCVCGTRRLGRGRALTEAFRQSSGSVLVYMDVDLATEVRFLRPLIEAITSGNDIATGSRMLPQSDVSRSLKRKILSLFYNSIVRLLLGSRVSDHQCGFKAFSRDALFKVLDEVHAKHWFWDTEILVIGARMGLSVKEIPVTWRASGRTKVNLRRDFIEMGFQILKLWWRLNIAGRHDPESHVSLSKNDETSRAAHTH